MDKNKTCDNCGICLGDKEISARSISVDEIIEDSDEYMDENVELTETKASEDDFEDEQMELIDDIEGLRDLLDNQAHLKKYTVEEFPGFIRFKNVKEP